jgi:dihydrofolate synthase/folylpolyglutamate synthase
LERVSAVAAMLGIDLAAFGADAAVIVGSNGKGSTAAMTAALLAERRSVGLFTSPHLLSLNERFRIDGEDITDEELEARWDRVSAATEASGLTAKMGGFEFLFLIAADWFIARGCKHTVWEAGIGGRLDPVALIRAKRLALTSLDLEHTALLGDTLSAIARQKLDAAPAGATVFVAQSCDVERGVIEAHAAQRDIRVEFVPPLSEAPLPGVHQRENAALALALARDLTLIANAEAGFARVRWFGRLEAIHEAPLIVIDVGHTPAGVRAALTGFQALRGEREPVLVCGASLDKNQHAIIGELAPQFSTIICAAARHKGAPAALIASIAAHVHPEAEIVTAENVADARRLALARGANKAIYVAGGLFLAAEFKAVHLGRDPALLAFF